MKITKEKIKKLQELYEREFGKKLSFEQATELGLALISVYFIFYDP